KVPNLLLQPLVENALTHGFEGMEGRGRVEVKAALIEGQIVLTVQDNGLGIGEGRLQELRDAMARDENSTEFFAMVNVARRLRLSFGDRAGIWVDSLAGQGTTVEIRLPSGKAREAGRGEAT
ncbi:MAG: two-component sensor histidine kinase, partial [Clostridia bacterium]|nr:two-component sensor histidine kinase [Clostridia bacterium]